MRIIGKEHLLEPMNRKALQIAREVADETGTLLAGDLSNTNIFVTDDRATWNAARDMFTEQVGWALDAGVDFFVAETFTHGQEAIIATEVIKDTGLPAVVTMSVHQPGVTPEGWTPAETCMRLEAAGAEVVGLNCGRGPATMLPMLASIQQAVSVHVAALPVPYRTTPEQPTFQSLRDPYCDCIPGNRPFPVALDPFTCNRYEIAEFTKASLDLGVSYFGICCGAAPHHIRAMAEALGRTPPASRYTADMSKHAFMGTDPSIKQEYREYAEKL
jgi:betaine-homocysteine S-methyltransferase